MARRFTRGVSRGAKRETSWTSLQPSVVAVQGGSAVLMGSLNATLLAKRPFTIIRSHFILHIATDQLSADERQFGAFGMCVVSDQAMGIGVTAVPTPITDANSDLWFVHQYLVSDFLVISAIGVDGDSGHQYQVDSKAMRKVNDDQDLAIVLEVSSVGDGTFIMIAGRILIKES